MSDIEPGTYMEPHVCPREPIMDQYRFLLDSAPPDGTIWRCHCGIYWELHAYRHKPYWSKLRNRRARKKIRNLERERERGIQHMREQILLEGKS